MNQKRLFCLKSALPVGITLLIYSSLDGGVKDNPVEEP